MTDRDIMQQALEALEDVPYMSNKDDYERLERVKTALRQALVDADDTSQERVDETVKIEQEPVAWMDSDGFPWSKQGIECRTTKDTYTPLYTAPPKREWVGLTDEEKSDLWCESTGRDWVNEDTHVFADAIEAKLKEKNT